MNPSNEKENLLTLVLEEFDQDFSILLIIGTLGELDEDRLPSPSIYRGAKGRPAALLTNRCSIGVLIALARFLVSSRAKK